MVATDEVRRMLDERGVEWRDSSDENVLHTTWNDMNCWFNEFPDGWTAWGMAMRGTPEQAVAATLGRGTCNDVCASISEFTCSACGFNCDLTSWISLFDGDDWRHRHHHYGTPNYCPNCGRKVVG